MVIIGTPHDLENYFMADGELAFQLHQKGFIPKYKDEGCLYFKLNNKLKKYLEKNGIK